MLTYLTRALRDKVKRPLRRRSRRWRRGWAHFGYINMIVDQVTELIEESCLAGSRGENKVVLVVGVVLSSKTFFFLPC